MKYIQLVKAREVNKQEKRKRAPSVARMKVDDWLIQQLADKLNIKTDGGITALRAAMEKVPHLVYLFTPQGSRYYITVENRSIDAIRRDARKFSETDAQIKAAYELLSRQLSHRAVAAFCFYTALNLLSVAGIPSRAAPVVNTEEATGLEVGAYARIDIGSERSAHSYYLAVTVPHDIAERAIVVDITPSAESVTVNPFLITVRVLRTPLNHYPAGDNYTVLYERQIPHSVALSGAQLSEAAQSLKRAIAPIHSITALRPSIFSILPANIWKSEDIFAKRYAAVLDEFLNKHLQIPTTERIRYDIYRLPDASVADTEARFMYEIKIYIHPHPQNDFGRGFAFLLEFVINFNTTLRMEHGAVRVDLQGSARLNVQSFRRQTRIVVGYGDSEQARPVAEVVPTVRETFTADSSLPTVELLDVMCRRADQTLRELLHAVDAEFGLARLARFAIPAVTGDGSDELLHSYIAEALGLRKIAHSLETLLPHLVEKVAYGARVVEATRSDDAFVIDFNCGVKLRAEALPDEIYERKPENEYYITVRGEISVRAPTLFLPSCLYTAQIHSISFTLYDAVTQRYMRVVDAGEIPIGVRLRASLGSLGTHSAPLTALLRAIHETPIPQQVARLVVDKIAVMLEQIFGIGEARIVRAIAP